MSISRRPCLRPLSFSKAKWWNGSSMTTSDWCFSAVASLLQTLKKTPQEDLKAVLEGIFSVCQSCFKQFRAWQRAEKLVNGVLSCMGSHTVTGWLTASGEQFKDWSAAYRLFKGDWMDIAGIFGIIRRKFVGLSGSGQRYVFAHMDDTLLRKKGKNVFGARWLRDALAPPSRLIWSGNSASFSFLCPVFQRWAQYRHAPFPLTYITAPL